RNATAEDKIAQAAEPTKNTDQNQLAGSNDGNIGQFQSLFDHQDTTAAQDASGNSTLAGSSAVDIAAGDDVGVDSSEVKSVAEADPEIAQGALQSNNSEQNQVAETD